MRWTIVMFLLLLAGSTAKAQVNLVRNGGFEIFTSCPTNADQIMLVKGWTPVDTITVYSDGRGNGNCSADYCNECSASPYATIPDNAFFFQNAHSGKGMMSVFMLIDEPFPSLYPY